MITRYDVMVYSALIGVVSLLGSGFLRDTNYPFTAGALAIIAIFCIFTGLLAYLQGDTK